MNIIITKRHVDRTSRLRAPGFITLDDALAQSIIDNGYARKATADEIPVEETEAPAATKPAVETPVESAKEPAKESKEPASKTDETKTKTPEEGKE